MTEKIKEIFKEQRKVEELWTEWLITDRQCAERLHDLLVQIEQELSHE